MTSVGTNGLRPDATNREGESESTKRWTYAFLVLVFSGDLLTIRAETYRNKVI